ncbi:type II toxin-antitoxin system Phd/YefM family antitoxin [Acinetobacter piscicola]|uniref:type II toxin-antitoxin system Phd/YefM family antitoxin n=1 Tax=Acinetobacter piscicola TaxID=2006115 RepID=UPI000B7CD1E4|nr:type II toxin-antitoxin system Phd/YefM family antitoxin [Acinetobacter piscicola]
MNNIILSRFVSSISELKKNPMEVVNNGFGEAVAILNRNNPAFYCVPADMYERMMDLIEDQELLKLAKQVENEPVIEVTIDELQAEIQRNRKKKV